MAGKGDENDQMQETGSQDQNEGEAQAPLQEEVAEDAVGTLSDDTVYGSSRITSAYFLVVGSDG